MLVTKLNLYDTEWLDVVFKNRNKSYGAYELRKSNGTNMLKSLLITFSSVGVSLALYSFTHKAPFVEPPLISANEREIPVEMKNIHPPKEDEKVYEATPKTELPKAAAKAAKVKTKAIPNRVVRDELVKTDPPKTSDEGAIGPINQDGPATEINIPAGTTTGTPGGTGAGEGDATGDEVHTSIGLSSLPEPYDGMEGWNKYLSRNLRYPVIAAENGLSGKVFISFIIEKDGTLTDIKVERGAGNGFDEEALRVLKKAKAWKPGTQNGRPVRVRYTIPISFTITNN
ncbi:energy transducer TonB [Mucilaginibacter roseus]|uniref:Energy transducer TonB n=1 Tax=Mucilaginibacter roseus TaxID=1528868 RepID=A0ABS8U6V0_9SPHI|nr:energy transducer TonB [Mucilaginibacter roseus]MCD8742047.1 energy transducer TonB [Mucilaginibacter roseus]